MKNRIVSMLAVLALLLSANAQAAIQVYNNNTEVGHFSEVNCDGTTVNCTQSGGKAQISTNGSALTPATVVATGTVTFNSTVVANGRVAASTQVASSSTRLAPSNMPYAVVLKNIGATGGPDGAGVGTELGNGVNGQTITFQILSAGGASGGNWILTPAAATGWTKITFNAIGQWATLTYINSTVGWIIVGAGASASVAAPTITTPLFTGN